MHRLGIAILGFVAFWPASLAVGEQPPVFCLGVDEPGTKDGSDLEVRMLSREIVRQAVLIAARDELGLATRDAALRELFPAGAVPPFKVLVYVFAPQDDQFELRIVATPSSAKPVREPWVRKLVIKKPYTVDALATEMEVFATKDFVQLLNEYGVQGTRPKRGTVTFPNDAKKPLAAWNEFAQFAAIRMLHATRTEGSSPEVLAALAKGYAQLGSLIEWNWSPAHNACKARALLYAERLVRESNSSAESLATRAYVRTLAGRFLSAEADLKDARKKLATEGSKSLPSWVNVLETFCGGHLVDLKTAKDAPDFELARYLKLVGVEMAKVSVATVAAVTDVLDTQADCFRAMNTLAATGSLGTLGSSAATAMQQYPISIYKRIQDVPGIPATINGEAAKFDASDEVEAEIEQRVRTVAELRKAADTDRSEPSLAVLAQLIDEGSFLRVYRQLIYENMLDVPQNSTLALYRPLFEHHPFAEFLEGYNDDRQEVEEAANKLVSNLNMTELEYTQQPMNGWLTAYTKQTRQIQDFFFYHSDDTFRDLMLARWFGSLPVPGTLPKFDKSHSGRLRTTCPKAPAAVAMLVERDWKAVEPVALELEKEHSRDAVVLTSLAHRYINSRRYDDAIRCIEKEVLVVPNIAAYRLLADIYRRQENVEKWFAAQQKALDLPSMGLEHAKIQQEIANYFLELKDWNKALEFAKKSSQSGSAWGMLLEAKCHELLGNWDQSERLVQATSQRYPGSAMEWLSWCERTGRGDVTAARKFAFDRFESLGSPLAARQLNEIGVFYLYTKEPEKALEVFRDAFRKEPTGWTGMMAAMLADQLKQNDFRDEVLKQLSETKLTDADERWQDYQSIAQFFLYDLEVQKPKFKWKLLNFENYENQIYARWKIHTFGYTTDAFYFVAWFFKNRGRMDEAKDFYKRSATSPLIERWTHILARKELRELKIEQPPLRDEEFVSP